MKFDVICSNLRSFYVRTHNMNFHLSNQIMLYIKNQTGTPLLGHEIVIIEMHNVRQQLQANADLGKCTLNTQSAGTPGVSTQWHVCVPLSTEKLRSRAFQRYMTCLYRGVIYLWKALELSFPMKTQAFAYLYYTFSRRPWSVIKLVQDIIS